MKALISVLSGLDNGNGREDKWTRSIAAGSKEFVEDVKTELGCLAKGRKTREAGEGYQLREPSAPYVPRSGVENGVIGVENGYFWDINFGESIR